MFHVSCITSPFPRHSTTLTVDLQTSFNAQYIYTFTVYLLWFINTAKHPTAKWSSRQCTTLFLHNEKKNYL